MANSSHMTAIRLIPCPLPAFTIFIICGSFTDKKRSNKKNLKEDQTKKFLKKGQILVKKRFKKSSITSIVNLTNKYIKIPSPLSFTKKKRIKV